MGIALDTSAFSTPSVVTKQLKLNQVGDRRKVRVSSNFLRLMGFNPGDRITPVPMMDGGFKVVPDEKGELKVHQRSYRRSGRSNNPLEAVVEFASQELLSQTMPAGTERFHLRMRNGELRICPVPNRVFNIKRKFTGRDPLKTMVALTGGVDVHCLASLGFKTEVILEYRPEEKRDKGKASLAEVHALNTLRNSPAGSPRVLINEDIYEVDINRLKALVDEGDPISVGVFSPQCDCFSTMKSESLKQRSIEDLSTTKDMVYPVMQQIQFLEFPVVVIENVRGFMDSDAGVMMRTLLRRWGYHVTDMVLNALDHGGIQGRNRYYCVASLFPGFEPPAKTPRNTQSIWPIIEAHLPECRDITNTSAIRNRDNSRVAALLTKDSTHCPTITKSQARGVSDAVQIHHEGRYYGPSEGLIKALMSIPESFDVSWCSKEVAIETLGQSIDYALHHKLMASVKAHVEENLGKGPVLSHTKQMTLQMS